VYTFDQITERQNGTRRGPQQRIITHAVHNSGPTVILPVMTRTGAEDDLMQKFPLLCDRRCMWTLITNRSRSTSSFQWYMTVETRKQYASPPENNAISAGPLSDFFLQN